MPGRALRVTGDGLLLHPGARRGSQGGSTTAPWGPLGLKGGVSTAVPQGLPGFEAGGVSNHSFSI